MPLRVLGRAEHRASVAHAARRSPVEKSDMLGSAQRGLEIVRDCMNQGGVRGDGVIRRMASRLHPDQQPAPVDVRPDVTLRDDGILHIDFIQYDRITLASIQYAHARHVALCPDRKIPALFKGKAVASVEYKAQRYLSSPEVNKGISAGAIVVKSFLQRHLARMFLIYHRPPYPVQVFSDEADALAWLRGFLPPA
jgi:hypothetical protein